ncbi:MAG: hypothetical protein GY938_32060 [Ketobacter sp.]|nr:hypothetical protein [Ketobacter sp.]
MGKPSIEFEFTVEKVQTMADGAIRLTLDMPETAVLQMSQFVECKRVGVAMSGEAVPIKSEKKKEYGGRLKNG